MTHLNKVFGKNMKVWAGQVLTSPHVRVTAAGGEIEWMLPWLPKYKEMENQNTMFRTETKAVSRLSGTGP